MRDLKCNTKEELRDYIKLFFGIDFPDAVVSDISNSSPMDMIWWIYKKSVLENIKIPESALFVAPRDGYKTLGVSVAELLSIIHGKRDVAHIGAIDKQSKKAYSYFVKFLGRHPLKKTQTKDGLFGELVDGQALAQETKFSSGNILETLPCTLARVNSPHPSLCTLDEVDTVRDLMAYRDISGMPVRTKDGRAPVKVSISTRKTMAGFVQEEIDNAKENNTDIFWWNVIDLTKKCTVDRHGEKDINVWVKEETLESISDVEYNNLSSTDKKGFVQHTGKSGCLRNCKLFAACKGRLQHQTSTSNLLYDIDYIQHKIYSTTLDWAIANLLCKEPSKEGMIYPTWKIKNHVKNYDQMYEIFTGEPYEGDTKLDFHLMHEVFAAHGIHPEMAVDFGDYLAVAGLYYTDGQDRIYKLREATFSQTDDNELAEMLWRMFGKLGITTVYPDVENPSGIRLLIKKGFPCTKRVSKDVYAGINTVRYFLKRPGKNDPRMFIHESCVNTIYEFPRYHWKKTSQGQVMYGQPAKEKDHSLDENRYFLHTKYGKTLAYITTISEADAKAPRPTGMGESEEIPTPADVIHELGLQAIDNTDEYRDHDKVKKERKFLEEIKKNQGKKSDDDDDPEDEGGDGGFYFGFL